MRSLLSLLWDAIVDQFPTHHRYLFMRMFAPSWRTIVIGVSGGMKLLSSICRHGLLEHQESHHSVHSHDSSREIQNLHNLGRANSTTGRNHVGQCHVHGHQTVPFEVDRTIAEQLRRPPQVVVVQCPSSHASELRMLQIRVASHNSLGCTIVQHARRQIMQLCKSISW